MSRSHPRPYRRPYRRPHPRRLPALLAVACFGLALAAAMPSAARAADDVPAAATPAGDQRSITIAFRGTPIAEAYEMLSRLGRVNILLGSGVDAQVTANLYAVSAEEAVVMIADAAGYAVERRGDSYLVLDREQLGLDAVTGHTAVRSFKVQYADPGKVAGALENYLSRYGEITVLEARKLLVISDRPEFLQRIARVLENIDVQPRQILIEAKILEVILRDDETFGVDWAARGGDGDLGTSGFSDIGGTGLFLNYLTDDLDLFLKALSENGRVRTLSTPKLLVLEDQDAEVVIGDRIGYRVTTTANQVTTESIEFLDSGVILKVRAAVDNQRRIMLDVHPEVSTGVVSDGIPSLTTTEVTTQMIAADGQPIFIGGLIKRSSSESRSAVPGLGDLPLVGGLFSRREDSALVTETVVLITPHLVEPGAAPQMRDARRRVDRLTIDLPPLLVPEDTGSAPLQLGVPPGGEGAGMSRGATAGDTAAATGLAAASAAGDGRDDGFPWPLLLLFALLL